MIDISFSSSSFFFLFFFFFFSYIRSHSLLFHRFFAAVRSLAPSIRADFEILPLRRGKGGVNKKEAINADPTGEVLDERNRRTRQFYVQLARLTRLSE